LSGLSGARNGSRSDSVPGVVSPAARPAGTRRRSSLGDSAKTSRTVSLKARMEEKPAAKAISAMGSGVVSMSSRAVWARWARASANGPAPRSASSCRSTWRVL
jgi:hypothetical protein